MAEHISQAERIILRIFPGQTGTETPHEPPGTPLCRKCFAINQERAGKLQIPVQFTADWTFPANHAGRAQPYRVAVTTNIIFGRITLRTGEGNSPVKREACMFMCLLENMNIIIINKTSGINTMPQIFHLNLCILRHCTAALRQRKNKNEKDKVNYTKEFNINGIKFSVKLCEGKDLEKFMEENQSHLDFCVNKERAKRLKKKNKTNLEEPIKLGEEVFNDISKIISLSFTIAVSIPLFFKSEAIKAKANNPGSCCSLFNATFIGIGKIDPHQYTKAFFGLDENKEKLFDFLVHKCPEKILIDDRKKSKEKK